MSVDLFDAKFYATANPDLAAAGINTADQLWEHFRTVGLSEGRKFSPLVDLDFYRRTNSDLVGAGLTSNADLYEHLRRYGVKEGRRFSPLVDLDFYFSQNPDVALAIGGDKELGWQHLQTNGIAEKRSFSQIIDLNYYLTANPDLQAVFGGEGRQTLDHLLLWGIPEGRTFLPGDLGVLGFDRVNPPPPIRLSEFVGQSDGQDIFPFRISSLSDVSVTVKGDAGNTRLGLIRDENNNGLPDELTAESGLMADKEHITALETFGLAPGRYFVTVTPEAGDTSYELSLFAGAAEIPNPDRDAAGTVNLGQVGTTAAIRDTITAANPRRLYQVQLVYPSEVRLSLAGASAETDLRLFQDINGNGLADAGEEVATRPNPQEPVDSNGNGIIDFSETVDWFNGTIPAITHPDAILAPQVFPGNYLIEVARVNEDTGYTLQMQTLAPAAPAAGAGNRTPFSWGYLGEITNTDVSVTDFVGHANPYDFYAFELQRGKNLTIRLQGQNADADLVLVRDLNEDNAFSSDEIIAFPPSERSANQEITRFFGEGIYYVGVVKVKDNTAYSLEVDFLNNDKPSDNAGNDLGSAADLGIPGAEPIIRRDWVNEDDREDFYRFQLNETTKISAFLYEMTGNAQLELIQDLNGNGVVEPEERIAGSQNKGGQLEQLDRVLLPGNYFLAATQAVADADYSIWLEAAPVAPSPEAGNGLPVALDLGALNSPQTASGVVDTADPHDIYKFRLETPGDLSLFLYGMSGNADLRLIRDDNGNGLIEPEEILALSVEGGATAEEISLQGLPAGEYYVWVAQAVGNTHYDLSVIPGNFSRASGYGLVNAAVAVAQAVGQPEFPAVAPLPGKDWALNAVKAPAVWSQGYTGDGIVVAVVDDGTDYSHPNLDDNIWVNEDEIPGNGIDDDANGFIDDVRGWDFWDGDNDPRNFEELAGHSTHVAGSIAGENNGVGVTGVAPGAKIMPVRTIGVFRGAEEPIIAGIRYAADNGADIINLSLGGSLPSEPEEEAIRYAVEKGVVVVMASGNDGLTNFAGGKRFSNVKYPAGFASEFGISVGAVDSKGSLGEFSNRAGTTPIDYVVAPGVDIYSALPIDTYSFWEGTSMATGLVSGVAALILSANPNLTPAQVEDLITGSGNPFAVTESGEYDLFAS
ncbi:S8 family peptidase [[Phormidium] sp. ETS-05]|uniref:S8 family peptidase n=1 Tax=[Phormidium] sp. ETS-05 TaxID=222819 RepID=UPI0018EF0433|nr:S8 family peptidase [[Phormidium] sp. ETS-05]